MENAGGDQGVRPREGRVGEQDRPVRTEGSRLVQRFLRGGRSHGEDGHALARASHIERDAEGPLVERVDEQIDARAPGGPRRRVGRKRVGIGHDFDEDEDLHVRRRSMPPNA
ncbi:MAG: hypothetical protein L3J91_01325 [Thermoplasmata archaeon]|nr:hypothetical protein [Thermoplasmata archaeon]